MDDASFGWPGDAVVGLDAGNLTMRQVHSINRQQETMTDKQWNPDLKCGAKSLAELDKKATDFMRKQREEAVPLEPFISNPLLMNVCQLRSIFNLLSQKRV